MNTSNRIEGSTLSYVETYAILWNDNSFNLNNDQPPVIIPDERRVEYFNYIAEYNTEGLAKMLEELQKLETERIENFLSISKGQKRNG